MSVSWQLLALPLTEALVMGLLAGLVGALALLDRRIFLTESLTHSTFPGAVAGVVAASEAATALTGARAGHETLTVALLIGAVLLCLPMPRLMRCPPCRAYPPSAPPASCWRSASPWATC